MWYEALLKDGPSARVMACETLLEAGYDRRKIKQLLAIYNW
jgi:hypothetical protein